MTFARLRALFPTRKDFPRAAMFLARERVLFIRAKTGGWVSEDGYLIIAGVFVFVNIPLPETGKCFMHIKWVEEAWRDGS